MSLRAEAAGSLLRLLGYALDPSETQGGFQKKATRNEWPSIH